MSEIKSGFENDPDVKQTYCRHPEHLPPMHLVIPHGKLYRHICPGCGKTTIIRSQEASL
jgi:pyruvate/2-oxoacid:ferredoxin oxidoreductase beta subunit